ncbi:MAG: hypothetical protein PHH16_01770 [Candidatus Gracilibacteria bacterium]|nr:hypothetical protein [Candidatus Gracilibacteria bacterium]
MNINSIKTFLQLFLDIFLPKNYNETTQENEVDLRISEIMSKGAIDNTVTKDDFIRLVIRIYGNDAKYKPFVSKIAILLRYFIRAFIIILIAMAIYASVSAYNLNDENIRENMHHIWILFTNFAYVLMLFYIIFNTYELIRKIMRHEIKKNRFIKLFLRPFLTMIFIPFTWFIGSALGSMILITQATITDLFK